MKKNKTILTVIFISTVLLSLWMRSCYRDTKFQLTGILFLLLFVLFAMGATWFMYRKEWCHVLGLKTNGITRKVVFKAFVTALLINIVGSGTVFVVYYLMFNEMPLPPLGDNFDPLKLISLALVLAPLSEEFLFRGFVQGLWQKLYSDKDKTPIKLIIVTTALLFTVSHFHFLFNITVKQFLLFTIPLFIVALYMSFLRNKYQSIIPSIAAHAGFNSALVIAPLIALLLSTVVSPDAFREIRRQQELAPYINDTIPYNFDPNNMDEWERSYKKFAVLERPRSEEVIKHLNGSATGVWVFFTIDTCGNVYNIHVLNGADTYYIRDIGYGYMEDVIKFIQSLPPCKPYIMDGKKVEKEMSVFVPFCPY